MSPDPETPAYVARTLSAVLQAILAEQVGGDEAAANAFLLEFSEDFAVASTTGPVEVFALYTRLFLDLCEAIYSLSKYVAQKTDQTPERVLAEVIRTYRKAAYDD